RHSRAAFPFVRCPWSVVRCTLRSDEGQTTMGTVSAEQSRDFYRAAASFYREAPWRSVGEGETIKIQCQQLESGPWYAVILGKMINIKGLMLFDDREGRRLMQRANYERIADRLRTIAVHYEDAGQADPKDV